MLLVIRRSSTRRPHRQRHFDDRKHDYIQNIFENKRQYPLDFVDPHPSRIHKCLFLHWLINPRFVVVQLDAQGFRRSDVLEMIGQTYTMQQQYGGRRQTTTNDNDNDSDNNNNNNNSNNNNNNKSSKQKAPREAKKRKQQTSNSNQKDNKSPGGPSIQPGARTIPTCSLSNDNSAGSRSSMSFLRKTLNHSCYQRSMIPIEKNIRNHMYWLTG